MLDQVLQRAVGRLGLVGPVGIAEDALQAFWIRGFDGEEGRQQRPADVAWCSAYVIPMRAFGNDEAVVGGGGRRGRAGYTEFSPAYLLRQRCGGDPQILCLVWRTVSVFLIDPGRIGSGRAATGADAG